MRVPMIETDEGYGPDLPEGFTGTATLTDDGDYLLTWDGPDPRIARLEAERDRLLAVLRDKQTITADDETLVRGETAEPERTR